MIQIFKRKERLCRARVADTFLSRLLGLMFKGSLKPEEGLLIEYSPNLKSKMVHGMFMRFSIDLVFLDREKRVVDTATLRPWRFYNPEGGCRWVLEVKKGFVAEKKIKKGDQFRFEVLKRRRR